MVLWLGQYYFIQQWFGALKDSHECNAVQSRAMRGLQKYSIVEPLCPKKTGSQNKYLTTTKFINTPGSKEVFEIFSFSDLQFLLQIYEAQ